MSNKEKGRGLGPVTVSGELGKQQKFELDVNNQINALAGTAVLEGKDSEGNLVLIDALSWARQKRRDSRSRNCFPSKVLPSGLTLCFFEMTPDDTTRKRAYSGLSAHNALDRIYLPFVGEAEAKLTKSPGFRVFDVEHGTELAIWGNILGRQAVQSLLLTRHVGFNPDASGARISYS